jgi:hypothetical protein
VFLYRSVAKISKRAGVLGEDSLELTTDLYKNTVVCLFLVICAWVGMDKRRFFQKQNILLSFIR